MNQFFSFDYMLASFPVLLSYVDVTLEITFFSILAGFLIGCATALLRVHSVPVADRLCAVYVSFVRGTPFLVQLFLIYFGLPQVLAAFGASDIRSVPGMVFVLIVMSLHEGGYLSEIIRGGILAVDKGQLEACRSLNISLFRSYVRIILPQALRMTIPVLGNTVISALKNTSLIFNVGVVDMMRKADLMGSFSYHHLELYLDVGIIYILLCFFVQAGTYLLDRRFKYTV